MLNPGPDVAQAVMHVAALPLLAVQQVVMQSLQARDRTGSGTHSMARGWLAWTRTSVCLAETGRDAASIVRWEGPF